MSVKAYLAAAAIAVFANAAGAATVLGVEGTTTGSTTLGLGQPDIGVAQSFTTTKDLTDASFDFNLRCLGCSGDLWLIEGEMSTSVLNSDIVARTTFDGSSGADAAFSGLSFDAGLYTIIMTMTSGNGFWRATDSPTVVGDAGTVPNAYQKFSTINANSLAWSTTSTVSGSSLKFAITTPDPVIAPVPLPASVGLLFVGLAGISVIRRRRA
ncbi:MAG: VPLPA-CTERM sorting domain-containing protein [Pseudomonadota bacterium]